MHAAGKFKEFGVSNFRPWQLMQIFHVMKERGWSPLPTVYQGAYSAVQRDAEKHRLPICRSEGMRYYAYSPLARGVLTGKFASAGAEGANPMQQRYLSPTMTDARQGDYVA